MAHKPLPTGSSYSACKPNLQDNLEELNTFYSITGVNPDKEERFRGVNRERISDMFEDLCTAANALYAGSVVFKNFNPGSSFRVNRKNMKTMTEDLYTAMYAETIVMVLSPATVAPLPTAEAWTRTVGVELQTAGGIVQTGLSGTFTTSVSIADDSTAGTASIASTTLTIVNGVGSIVVSGDEAAWLATETDTLTIAELTIRNATVATKTSVETFTAA